MKSQKKTSPAYKTQWLRLGLIWTLILSLSFVNFSCNDDDNSEEQEPDTYYVKYIVSSTTTSGGYLNMTINTEKNQDKTIVISQNAKNETTIGPVSKGFNAKLKVVSTDRPDYQVKLYTEIQVCKNESPFAMKAINGSNANRDSVELRYTIDY